MTWVRIDDGAPLHPKLLDAGPEAAWLWACGLAHCNRNHTDGRIAARHLPSLYPGAWDPPRLLALAAVLVDVGLWERDGVDYLVHDYAHYQAEATREAVEVRRAYERERKALQRAARRRVPDNVPDKSGNVPRDTSVGHPPGHAAGQGESAVVSPRPGPPRPVPLSSPNGELPPQGPAGPAAPPASPKGKGDEPPPAPGTPAARTAAALAGAPRLGALVKRPNALATSAASAFPGLDAPAEVAKADGWCAANPTKAPRSAGDAFVWRWLQRAHNDAANRAAAADQRAPLFARPPPRRVGPAPVPTAEEFARATEGPDPLFEATRG